MGETFFAVFKEGYYRHACGGIFNNEKAAIRAAEILRDGESDNYHNYIVVPFEINKITEQVSPLSPPEGYHYTYLEEPETIYDSGCKDLTL